MTQKAKGHVTKKREKYEIVSMAPGANAGTPIGAMQIVCHIYYSLKPWNTWHTLTYGLYSCGWLVYAKIFAASLRSAATLRVGAAPPPRGSAP